MEDNDQIMKDSNYSVAIPKPDGYNLRGLQWTTEPPTEKGWWWVITNSLEWKNAPECVYVGYPEYNDILYVYGINPLHEIESVDQYHNRYLRHWLGPLPVPELPKGE